MTIYQDAIASGYSVEAVEGTDCVVLIVRAQRSTRIVCLTPESAEALAADLIRHAATLRAGQAAVATAAAS